MIPQIVNGGQTYSTTQANNKALPRSLYQTHQGGKYNFITPMILSDLHQISSIQSAANQNNSSTQAQNSNGGVMMAGVEDNNENSLDEAGIRASSP